MAVVKYRLKIGTVLFKTMKPEMTRDKKIWAIGGGKGGTGKSFLSASLAIELGARQGDVILIDADFGGPNLHTVLAVRDGGRDLGGFLKNDFPALEDILLPTAYPGLKLIKGNERALFGANLHHAKKLKLIRQLKSLPASLIILDLGTGSAFNTLDFFILGKPGILVVTPEPTAVENAYYFLRCCAARILKLYAQFYKIPDLAGQLAFELEKNSLSLRACLERLKDSKDRMGTILLSALKNFRPALIVNKAQSEKDFLLGPSMVDVARHYFLIELQLLATIPYDERVLGSLKKFSPFVRAYPESEVSRAIKKAADALLEPEGEEKRAPAPLV